MEKAKAIRIYGIEAPVFLFFALVIGAGVCLNTIPVEMIGAIAILFLMGIVLGKFGEWLPFWRTYCGGGAVMAFVVSGLLTYYKLLPEAVIANAQGWMNEYNVLNVFIGVMIVGSLLGMNRRVLIKSGSLYIPAILAAIAGAALLSSLGGLLIGKTPLEIVTTYTFPMMGGGAGAGAIPMAQVYADVTGNDQASYLSFALAILALGNILAIICGALLNAIGEKFPKLAGKTKLLRDEGKVMETEQEQEEAPVAMDDIAGGVFLTAGFFMLGSLMSSKVLPYVFGVRIPTFAYLIIFTAAANICNLIPDHLRRGAQKCQQFFAGKLVWVQMVGCGIVLIDFEEMLSALSPANLFIIALVVFGAMIGAAVFGWLVGFYPIESAVTAGLCMTNMGGSGDLAVLGAAKRMGLMSYAQISSRIGGALVLMIASVVFSLMS